MHAPWVKVFVSDYLSSPFVQALEPEQELWYLRLILASIIGQPPGCVPLDNRKLWRLAKAPSQKYFEKYCGSILAQFVRDEVAGLLRLPALAEQLAASSDLSKKRARAGQAGAFKRWAQAEPGPGGLTSTPIGVSR